MIFIQTFIIMNTNSISSKPIDYKKVLNKLELNIIKLLRNNTETMYPVSYLADTFNVSLQRIKESIMRIQYFYNLEHEFDEEDYYGTKGSRMMLKGEFWNKKSKFNSIFGAISGMGYLGMLPPANTTNKNNKKSNVK
jgi:hypothetical protein